MNEDIDFIKNHAQQASGIELENISRDLSLFVSRIKTGEYKNTDFLKRQSFDTPRRVHEFFNYLIGYYNQASDWVSILKQVPLRELQSICDLCPGSSPKVQWALQRLNYGNKLAIVDQDLIAIEQMQVLLKIFQANYNVAFLPVDIFSLSDTYDLVTANHIIDDLVLYNYCIKNKVQLRSLYGDEALFIKATNHILNNEDKSHLANELATLFDRILKEKGYLIMVQYAGLTEKALQLEAWCDWNYQIMLHVYELLMDKKYQSIFITNKPKIDFFSEMKEYFILKKPGYINERHQ